MDTEIDGSLRKENNQELRFQRLLLLGTVLKSLGTFGLNSQRLRDSLPGKLEKVSLS